jgi:uncharacterized membrane protein
MATIKLLHVLFVFIWIGNLLATTRILGYLAKQGEIVQQQVAGILRRMRLLVGLPSMFLAWIFGAILITDLDFTSGYSFLWLHVKMSVVLILMVCENAIGKDINNLTQRPIKGRGVRFKVQHGVVGLSLIMVLVCLYLVRPYVGTGDQKASISAPIKQQEKLLGKNPAEV